MSSAPHYEKTGCEWRIDRYSLAGMPSLPLAAGISANRFDRLDALPQMRFDGAAERAGIRTSHSTRRRTVDGTSRSPASLGRERSDCHRAGISTRPDKYSRDTDRDRLQSVARFGAGGNGIGRLRSPTAWRRHRLGVYIERFTFSVDAQRHCKMDFCFLVFDRRGFHHRGHCSDCGKGVDDEQPGGSRDDSAGNLSRPAKRVISLRVFDRHRRERRLQLRPGHRLAGIRHQGAILVSHPHILICLPSTRCRPQ